MTPSGSVCVSYPFRQYSRFHRCRICFRQHSPIHRCRILFGSVALFSAASSVDRGLLRRFLISRFSWVPGPGGWPEGLSAGVRHCLCSACNFHCRSSPFNCFPVALQLPFPSHFLSHFPWPFLGFSLPSLGFSTAFSHIFTAFPPEFSLLSSALPHSFSSTRVFTATPDHSHRWIQGVWHCLGLTFRCHFQCRSSPFTCLSSCFQMPSRHCHCLSAAAHCIQIDLGGSRTGRAGGWWTRPRSMWCRVPRSHGLPPQGSASCSRACCSLLTRSHTVGLFKSLPAHVSNGSCCCWLWSCYCSWQRWWWWWCCCCSHGYCHCCCDY